MDRYSSAGRKVSDQMATHNSLGKTEIERVSQMFKMLGHPKRLQLLNMLIQHSMSVSEISEALDWEQSAVSHQLRLLRTRRMVKQKRQGKTVIYQLADPQIMTFIVDAISRAREVVEYEERHLN